MRPGTKPEVGPPLPVPQVVHAFEPGLRPVRHLVVGVPLPQQAERPRLVCADTMNYWIDSRRGHLLKLLPRVDVLMVNDSEVRQLAGEANVLKAAAAAIRMGAKAVVVKRGEYGALLMTDGTLFFVPAYPLESVYDPTGAGDTFAGGFMGYLAAQDRVDAAAMRRAIVYGTVMASFTVEDFSLKRLTLLKPSDIAERYAALHELIRVEP